MEFEQLAARYSNMIYSIIHSLHIYKNQDEFYQIGLIALWKASQKYDEQKGKFATYAYLTIRGELLMHLNKEKKWKNEENSLIEEDWQHLQSYNHEPFELESLLSHFHHLTDRQKNWVILRFYYGLTNKEIAEKVQTNVNSVKSCGRLAMKNIVGVE